MAQLDFIARMQSEQQRNLVLPPVAVRIFIAEGNKDVLPFTDRLRYLQTQLIQPILPDGGSIDDG
ncbi:hypothetical protein D3C73_1628670 [compost metagenome]